MSALKDALDFSIFWEYRSLLLSGIAVNFHVWIWALVLAHVVGLGSCLLRINRHRPMRIAGTLYVELVRNSPEYVLLTWVHFVLPLLLTIALQTKLNFPPFVSAVIALGCAYSGYLAETYRSGILSVPRGHVEAGRALGMSGFQCMWRLVLPQAVRRVLPEMLNQAISLFKATTLVSLIAVPDLLYNVVIVTQEEMRPLPLYTWAAIVYSTIIFCASTLVRNLTSSWQRRGWS